VWQIQVTAGKRENGDVRLGRKQQQRHQRKVRPAQLQLLCKKVIHMEASMSDVDILDVRANERIEYD
jgi:hypothetical protein